MPAQHTSGSLARHGLVQVEDHHPGKDLKVADVTGQKRKAVGPYRGGNDGVGQLHAVLLAEQDGLLRDGLIQRQHFHTLHEGQKERKLGSWQQFFQQFYSGDNRNSHLLSG